MQSGDPEDTEMAVEALDAFGIVRPTKEDDPAARGQSQDGSRGQFGSCGALGGPAFKLPKQEDDCFVPLQY